MCEFTEGAKSTGDQVADPGLELETAVAEYEAVLDLLPSLDVSDPNLSARQRGMRIRNRNIAIKAFVLRGVYSTLPEVDFNIMLAQPYGITSERVRQIRAGIDLEVRQLTTTPDDLLELFPE